LSVDGYNAKWGQEEQGDEGGVTSQFGSPLNPSDVRSLSGGKSGESPARHVSSPGTSANELFKPDPVYGRGSRSGSMRSLTSSAEGGSVASCACCTVS
jgi:hypothetical protein